MNKKFNLMFAVFLISAVLAMSLVSASWFSDLFNPTGYALKEKALVEGTNLTFSDADSKTGIIKFTTPEGKITEVEEDAIVKTNKGDFKVEITKPFIGPARVKFTPSTETSNVDLTPKLVIPLNKTNVTKVISSAECYRQGILDLLVKCAPAMEQKKVFGDSYSHVINADGVVIRTWCHCATVGSDGDIHVDYDSSYSYEGNGCGGSAVAAQNC